MSKTLLLADDSVVIQKLVGLSFANEDVTLVTTDNGDDAVARARETRPDLVLADVVMPGKNGYEVCEALKQDPELAHVPVLLLTGTFEAFDEERARSAGSNGHITKPFEAQVLVDRVKELLAAPPPAAASPMPEAIAAPDAEAADAYDFFESTPAEEAPAAKSVAPPPIAPETSDETVAMMPDPMAAGEGDTDPLGGPAVQLDPMLASEAATADAMAPPPIGSVFDDPSASAPSLDLSMPASASEPPALDLGAAPPSLEIGGPEPAARSAIPMDTLGETVLAEDLLSPPPLPAEDAASPLVAAMEGADPAATVLADDLLTEPTAAPATTPGLSPDPAHASPPPIDGPMPGPSPAKPRAGDTSAAMLADDLFDAQPGLAPEAPAAGAPSDPAAIAAAFGTDDPLADPSLGEPAARAAFEAEPVSLEPAHDEPLAEALPLEPSTSPEPMFAPETPMDAMTSEDAPTAPGGDLPGSLGDPHFDAGASSASLELGAPGSAAPDLSPMLRERLHETLEKVAWEAFADLSDSIVKQVVARVEQIAWETIPQMAEALVREEIRRMKGEDA